jgi:hypothetical protein
MISPEMLLAEQNELHLKTPREKGQSGAIWGNRGWL